MGLRVHELHGTDFEAHHAAVSALERGVTYPLGHDRFAIDHGSAYHPFFSALGDARFLVALLRRGGRK